MRKILLMVFAITAIMSLATAGAMADQGKGSGKSSSSSSKSSSKKSGKSGKKCNTRGHRGENSGKGNCKDRECPAGTKRHGHECRPEACPPGQKRHGDECRDDDDDDEEECPANEVRDMHGDCVPKPCPAGTHPGPDPHDCIIDVPPVVGPCAKADVVLLRDLIKGTGALDSIVCLFFGDNAPNASNQAGGDCPGALLALPVDNLIGACLLVPADDSGSTPGLPALPSLPGLPLPGSGGGLPDASTLLNQLTATLTFGGSGSLAGLLHIG